VGGESEGDGSSDTAARSGYKRGAPRKGEDRTGWHGPQSDGS
jgi:hypothetical protein